MKFKLGKFRSGGGSQARAEGGSGKSLILLFVLLLGAVGAMGIIYFYVALQDNWDKQYIYCWNPDYC